VIYALRFMVDTGMGGGSWVELPAGSWRRVPQDQVRRSSRPPTRVVSQLAAPASQAPRGFKAQHAALSLAAAVTRPRVPRGRLLISPSPHLHTPSPKYRAHQAATYCQIEAHVKWDRIIVHPAEGAPPGARGRDSSRGGSRLAQMHASVVGG
jgi:hypothetical protein